MLRHDGLIMVTAPCPETGVGVAVRDSGICMTRNLATMTHE
jgi:hypothetical protein